MKKAPWKRGLSAACYTVFVAALFGLLFDYYFDLNDDVLIKDILAGVHTGTPGGYSIQMLYPVSALIGFFYRLFRAADWFGLFLCACQYLCVFLVAERSLFLYERYREGICCGRGRMILEKTGILVTQGAFFAGFFLWQFIYVQYTVVCGMMTATAVFLLYTASGKGTAKQFFKSNIVSIVLLVTAFQVRTEMFLLLLPLIGAAGMCKWLEEGFARQWRKYAGVIAIVAAGMGAGYLFHMAAYSSPQWSQFQRIFDARTQIYDFYGLPEYEQHRSFYTSIGMSRAEYELLDNYNYGVDESLDAERLEALEAYAEQMYETEHRPAQLLQTAVWEYKQRLLGRMDAPYSGAVLFGYLCVIAAMAAGGRAAFLWQPALLFAARSVSWFYILYRQRVVERITLPLYLMELLLLAAMLWRTVSSSRKAERRLPYVCRIAVLVLALWSAFLVPESVGRVSAEQERREQVNEPQLALQEYCTAHGENYYYVNVYSTVRFSEKMFEKVDNSKRNYDIIGGWACKSPISGQEKLRYLITDSGHDTAWLEAYYAQTRPEVTVQKTDTFPGGGDWNWEVYEIVPAQR